MPRRLVRRMFTRTHEFLYRRTRGVVGGRFRGAPILLLTTTGRKSGKQRTTPLLYYPNGDNLVIIGSAGGSDHHPAWYVNLVANPRAEVQVAREKKTVTAETASPDEKARLWPLLTERYSFLSAYQNGTSRDIPVVLLKKEA